MARFSKADREQRIEQASRMYCKGFDAKTISDIMSDVSERTVEKWIRDYEFEKKKKSQVIALSEIRNSILESYADVLEGKEPRISADQAVKYANAFEKFSSKKQVLSYMYEAFELLSEEFMTDLQKAKKAADKEKLLVELRSLRGRMDKVLTRLTKEVLGDE
ncbi:MAG: hypothetical protein AB7D35_13330 [Bacteroidales bacterium]